MLGSISTIRQNAAELLSAATNSMEGKKLSSKLPIKKVSPTLRLFKIKLVPIASGRVRLPKIELKSNFSIHGL